MFHTHRPSLSFRFGLISGLIFAFVVLCLWPYRDWVAYPSLYHDDFMRVGSLRKSTLVESLFRPFNEHMAPLFELVSWLAWRSSGQRVASMPLALMIASFLAFASTVGLLGVLIRRETGSYVSSLGALAIFCLSSVSAETVLWYSASSFQWGASAMLLAWLASSESVRAVNPRTRKTWLTVSLVASMAAPAFSAIGALAAPIASLRLMIVADGSRTSPRFRRLGRAIVPMTGLAVYLLICSRFRYQEVVGQSLSKNLDLVAATWATLRAPSMVLLPSLVGLPDFVMSLSTGLAVALTLILTAVSLALAVRSRDRALILGGLALIAGGYFLAYGARAHDDDLWVLRVPRYHLFPQLGMVCLLAGVLAPLSRRLERSPIRGVGSVVLLALGLLLSQAPGMKRASESCFRYPDQPRLLLAEARLEAVAVREQITLIQAMRALDPIEPRWSPFDWNFHPILFLFPSGPEQGRLNDSEVRSAFISGLDLDDRGLIFGGMEATRYRRPASNWDSSQTPVLTELVDVHRFQATGQGQYRSLGPGYLEFRGDSLSPDIRAVCLPGLRFNCRRPVEFWWSDDSGTWSPERSVRWKVDPSSPEVEWAVPLDQLPHWKPGYARRFRVILRDTGELAVGNPRFLR